MAGDFSYVLYFLCMKISPLIFYTNSEIIHNLKLFFMKKLFLWIALVCTASSIVAQWSQLGPSNGTNGKVQGLCRFKNKIYACGYFPCPILNGISTLTATTATSSVQFHQGTATGFIEYNNELLCYGSFDSDNDFTCNPYQGSMTMWLDSVGHWCSRGGILSGGYINCAAVYQGQLYIGGAFSFIDSYGRPVCGVTKWNGTEWISPGFYLGNTIGAPQATALSVYQGTLYVGGFFTKVNNTVFASPHILTWNGTTTQSVGGGFNNSPIYTTSVTSFAVYQNELWIAGYFSVADGMSVTGLVKYSTTVGYMRPPFKLASYVLAAAVYQGRLYLSQTGYINFNTAGMLTWRLFSYDGSITRSEEAGLYFASDQQNVYALYPDSIKHVLYVGGSFTRSSTGAGSNYIASRGVVSLPIKLENFSCSSRSDAIILDWQTASEIDNDHFEIERSTDAEVFETIGEMKGAGTTVTPHTYRFEDRTMLPNETYYYRLKQVDVDGACTRSFLVSCKTSSVDAASFEVICYRASNTFSCKSTDKGEMYLYDISGRELYRGKMNGALEYDAGHLPGGLYFVVLRTSSQTFVRKIFKQ
jgi:hypothetical protein